LQKFLRKFISEDGRVINNKQTNVSRNITSVSFKFKNLTIALIYVNARTQLE